EFEIVSAGALSATTATAAGGASTLLANSGSMFQIVYPSHLVDAVARGDLIHVVQDGLINTSLKSAQSGDLKGMSMLSEVGITRAAAVSVYLKLIFTSFL